MKRRNPIALITGWLAVMFAPSPVTSAAETPALARPGAETGSIIGQVSNGATKSFLEGAVVSIAGSDRAVITDREGRYVLNNVSGEIVTLEATFSGLDPQRVTVPVGAGRHVVRNIELNSDIYKMDKFTVAGVREGTALAETLQRIAPNVKNVISSDAFGNQASGNIAEYLQHVVGITGNYNGPDVFQVNIRGVGPALNSVTMDGQQISTSQSANTGRQFEFEQASLGNIETIEVTKAPTPDMDGASIGGSINLVSKSAFDRADPRSFRYALGFAKQWGYFGEAGRWNQPIPGWGPSVQLSYTDVIGPRKNIGLTFTANVNSQPVGGMWAFHSFEQRATPGPAYDYAPSWLDVQGATFSRATSGLKIDYKLNERTTFSFNTFYNFFHGNNDDHTWTLTTVGVPTAATPQVLATIDANGNRIGGGYIHPNYAGGITRVFAHPTLSTSDINHNTNTKAGRTFLFSGAGKHRFEGLNLDYSLSYSNSATFYNTGGRTKFDDRRKGNVTLRLGGIGWLVDRSVDPVWPTIRQTEGANMYSYSSYMNAPLTLAQNERTGRDDVLAAKLDLKKDVPIALPTYVKTGVSYQMQHRRVHMMNRRFNYAGPDGVAGSADDTSGRMQFMDTRGIKPSDDEVKYLRDRGGAPQWPGVYAIAQHRVDHPGQWVEDVPFHVQNRLQNNRYVEESIGAAYIMGNVRLGRLSTLAGVRFEQTKLFGEGGVNYISPAEAARRAAWVGPVTVAEAVRRVEAQYGGRNTDDGKYNVVLPGVHLKYQLSAGLQARASWSTGVGRPPFGNIIPATTIDDTARRVTISNPELQPQYGNNFDLGLEYYFKPQGMLSVGAFRKKIRDYIYTDTSRVIPAGADNGFDGDYAGYSLSTSANGGSAKIEGLEFSYQQQLMFLPGWLRGFGVYANYTMLKTEGNYGGTAMLTGNTLPNFIPKNGNAGISYRGYGIDIRVQAVHRGEYLTTNSTNPALVRYQVSKTTWNLKTRYDLTRRMSLFLDVENLFSVPLDRIYAGYKDRIVSNRTFHAKINGGITGRF